MIRRPPRSTPFPTRRSSDLDGHGPRGAARHARLDVDQRSECRRRLAAKSARTVRSEEHTSELQSLRHLVCRLLLEKKKKKEQTERRRNKQHEPTPHITYNKH